MDAAREQARQMRERTAVGEVANAPNSNPSASRPPATSGQPAASPSTSSSRTPPQPPPADETGLVPVPADLMILVGTPLKAEYARSWRDVTARKPSASGSIFVHWEGYADSFDEDLPREKLWMQPGTLAALKMGTLPVPVAPASTPSTPTEFKVGMALEASYGSRWLPVRVLETREDGKIKIHWDDYSDAFDEWVEPSKLRLPQK